MKIIDAGVPAQPCPWWEKAVVYHVYPRSFQDSDGDGVGDLPGLIRRLGYLQWLGVDALWLSPIYRSPMADFGYDVADHTAVDPVFGTIQDVDDLLVQAHRAGLRVLLDYVPNHTSHRHPWFSAARSGRDNPRRDWYVWRDPAAGGGPPNNWTSYFGGPAWTLDVATGQYYLHTFLPDQPDLNWRNPAVAHAMLDVLRFWVDRGVDGFRIDSAEHVLKDPLLRDNPRTDTQDTAGDGQLHIHDRGHPDNHALYRRIRRLLDRAPGGPRVALAEVLVEPRPDRLAYWAGFYGADLDEVHLPMNLALSRLPWSADAFAEAIVAVEAALPPGGWPTIVFGSHDEPRVASRYGPAAARLMLCLLLTLRGTPVLYNGDELGLPNIELPPGQALDPWGRHDGGHVRDRGRGPIPWAPGPGAGFTTGRPWLPLPPAAETLSVQSQYRDPGSTLWLSRRLCALRRSTPALRDGAYQPAEPLTPQVLTFDRVGTDQVVRVAANFASNPVPATLPQPARLLLATGPHTRLDTSKLTLGAHEAAVLSLAL